MGFLHSLGTRNTSVSALDKAVDQLKSVQHLTRILKTLDRLKENVSDFHKTVRDARDTAPASIRAQLASLGDTQRIHTRALRLDGPGIFR